MPVLVAVRDAGEADTDDLLWPSIGSDLQIRLAPDETVLWRGTLRAGEVRRDASRQSQRAWRMPESTICTVTDRRVTFQSTELQRDSGRLATIAWSIRRSDLRRLQSVAAGQVRFQWPKRVSVNTASMVDGAPAAGISLVCQDGDIEVDILLILTEKTSGPSASLVAADLAKLLVSNIAGFRLEARAGQLSPEQAQRLAALRDDPNPAEPGPSVHWILPGALKIGQPPTPAVSEPGPRFESQFQDAAAALKRYWQGGKPSDLQKTLDVCRALTAASPNNLAYMNLYALALGARHERTGDLTDLARAISAMREVVRRGELEEPLPWLASASSNLGGLLIKRWQIGLNEQDLVEGIAAHEVAMAATPHDSPEWAGHASNLGIALRSRYPVSGDAGDIDRAIKLCQEALSRAPRRTPDRGDGLANLGFALLDRHRVSNSRDDLKSAVEYLQSARRLLPRGAPARSLVELALAEATARPLAGQITPLADHNPAVTAWRKICHEGRDGSQVNVLRAATLWSGHAARHGNWADVAEACEFGLAAANQLFRLQLTREHKALWLEEARQLPALAAYALAKLGKLEQAAITLERGRALFLSEAMEREHANLDQLTALGLSELREQYQLAVERLAGLESANQGRLPALDAGGFADESAQAAGDARDQLEQAVAAIRKVSGYEEFLAPAAYADIISAAVSSPIVYAAITEVGGIALIVDGRGSIPAAPTVVWLEELTEAALMALLKEYIPAYVRQLIPGSEFRTRWLETLDAVTRRLWDVLLAPILSAVVTDRLILLPGDQLGLLPLHAAWREDRLAFIGRRYALDDVVITYAPSALALRYAQQQATSRTAPVNILIAYDSQLASSALEVQAISAWFSQVKQFRLDQTTLDMVQAALPEYGVLHFSCHGVVDRNDPLASHLKVAVDGNLTLRDVLRLQIPRARLAVLSACETALAGADLPEEVISLPSGFLQSGAAGVLGSLWPVGDSATCALMVRFYELWQGEGIDPAEALRQAQRWLRDTCASDEEISYGETVRDGHKAHVHPTHWAAFAFTGV